MNPCSFSSTCTNAALQTRLFVLRRLEPAVACCFVSAADDLTCVAGYRWSLLIRTLNCKVSLPIIRMKMLTCAVHNEKNQSSTDKTHTPFVYSSSIPSGVLYWHQTVCHRLLLLLGPLCMKALAEANKSMQIAAWVWKRTTLRWPYCGVSSYWQIGYCYLQRHWLDRAVKCTESRKGKLNKVGRLDEVFGVKKVKKQWLSAVV